MANNRFFTTFSIFASIILISSCLGSATVQQKTHTFAVENDTQNTVKLLSPLSSFPIFVEQNGNFTITFESANFDQLFASISTAYEPVVDEFWLDIENTWKTGSTWYALALIPPDTPPELYNLTLVIQRNGAFFSCSQPRAVNIITGFSTNFTFIHVTDLHIGDPRGFRENIRETIGYKSVKKCIDEINLLHPDFVIISGDLVFGQLYPFEYTREYKQCFELLQLFDVPTFLCPGNHDGYYKLGQDGLEFWKHYFGPLYYSFDYGTYHFAALNSYDWPPYMRRALWFITLNWGGYISDDQLQWIEEDLTHASANLTFMFLHHNPLWDTTTDSLLRQAYHNRHELLALIDEYNVDMVLAGHVHFDNVTVVNDTVFLTTTTPESDIQTDDGYWGYRRIQIQSGNIVSYNYKDPKYSIPSYHLTYRFHNPYTAIVENDLEENITVSLKFLVPLGNYSVQNGSIIQQRENTYQTEIYVVAEVEKQNSVIVTLTPSS